MSLYLVQEVFEHADPLGYIKAGADATEYDKVASNVFKAVSTDLSEKQICDIIWECVYWDFCFCTVGNSNNYWALPKNEARAILGEASKFLGIARNLRHLLFNL